MTATLKVFSLLLCYPTAEVQESILDCADALRRERLVDDATLDRIVAFMEDFAERDLYDLQERYVLLFDRTRSLCLHLFEHVHGESRERGQAMVALLDHYSRNGLDVSAKELPDYLPMFLEFASLLPIDEAREMVGEIQHILAALRGRLEKRDSPYAHILKGIEEISCRDADLQSGEIIVFPDTAPDDLDALDKEWEEEPVTFGPSAPGMADGGSCPAARSTLARMDQRIEPAGDRLARMARIPQ